MNEHTPASFKQLTGRVAEQAARDVLAYALWRDYTDLAKEAFGAHAHSVEVSPPDEADDGAYNIGSITVYDRHGVELKPAIKDNAWWEDLASEQSYDLDALADEDVQVELLKHASLDCYAPMWNQTFVIDQSPACPDLFIRA